MVTLEMAADAISCEEKLKVTRLAEGNSRIGFVFWVMATRKRLSGNRGCRSLSLVGLDLAPCWQYWMRSVDDLWPAVTLPRPAAFCDT